MKIFPIFSPRCISYCFLVSQIPNWPEKDAVLINSPALTENDISVITSYNLKAVLITGTQRSLTDSLFMMSKIYDIPFIFQRNFDQFKSIKIDDAHSAYSIENFSFIPNTNSIKKHLHLFDEDTIFLSGESPISCKGIEVLLQKS